MLPTILFFSAFGGIFSLIGGLSLLAYKKWSKNTIVSLISFAAGVLLTVSFTDLLPEAIRLTNQNTSQTNALLNWTFTAMVGFFLFERSFVWFHHHHQPHPSQPQPMVAMVWFGDTLHNFIDGLVITASFFVSIPVGIATSLAVAAHEIPQEIADFSLYLSHGISKTKTLALNLISSLATIIASIISFYWWDNISPWQPYLLAFTAGMFIYIAGSDLIPELHDEYRPRQVKFQIMTFLVGILITIIIGKILN